MAGSRLSNQSVVGEMEVQPQIILHPTPYLDMRAEAVCVTLRPYQGDVPTVRQCLANERIGRVLYYLFPTTLLSTCQPLPKVQRPH